MLTSPGAEAAGLQTGTAPNVPAGFPCCCRWRLIVGVLVLLSCADLEEASGPVDRCQVHDRLPEAGHCRLPAGLDFADPLPGAVHYYHPGYLDLVDQFPGIDHPGFVPGCFEILDLHQSFPGIDFPLDFGIHPVGLDFLFAAAAKIIPGCISPPGH